MWAGNQCYSSACESNRKNIIGENVNATTPKMVTTPASVKANSQKSDPVRPP